MSVSYVSKSIDVVLLNNDFGIKCSTAFELRIEYYQKTFFFDSIRRQAANIQI